MGSIGTSVRSSGATSVAPAGTVNPNVQAITPVNSNNPNVQNQTPNATNTPVAGGDVVAQLSQMTDAEMAALVRASKNAQLPNFLNDLQSETQNFVFQAGINAKPMVLDANEYNQFLKDNNINPSDQMVRSVAGVGYVNADGTQVNLRASEVNDLTKYSRANYIGGKRGGRAVGEGTYFEVTGGRVNSYGNSGTGRYGNTKDTMTAVLNPARARVIYENTLYQQVRGAWGQAHPQTVRALGGINSGNQSIYATLMGYNVVSDTRSQGQGTYNVVIDRSAIVIRK